MAPSETLAHFANWKLAGDRIVRDVVVGVRAGGASASASARGSFWAGAGRGSRGASPYGPGVPGAARYPRGGSGGGGARRRRRLNGHAGGGGGRSSSSGGGGAGERVGAMTDAELEAELAARRAARSRERARYARAMRSEKLVALEEELMRLRGEISRIDPDLPRRAAGIAPLDARQHAQSHVSWDLPDGRPGSGRRYAAADDTQTEQDAGPRYATGDGDHDGDGGFHQHSGSAPPPPPLRGVAQEGDFDDLVVDPEQRRREKEERQRRREEKRKQREAAKKPMTLADIIRSAGPDPIRRLKPASKKPADIEAEAVDGFANLKDMLTTPEEKERGDGAATESEAVVATGASDAPPSTIADDAGQTNTEDSASQQLSNGSGATHTASQPRKVATDKDEIAIEEKAAKSIDNVDADRQRGVSGTGEDPPPSSTTSAESVAPQTSAQTLEEEARADSTSAVTKGRSSSEKAALLPFSADVTGTQDGASDAQKDAVAACVVERKGHAESRDVVAEPVVGPGTTSAQEKAATAALASISSLSASLPSLIRKSSQSPELISDHEHVGSGEIGSGVQSVTPPLSSQVAAKSPERMTLAEKRLLRRSGGLPGARPLNNEGSSGANASETDLDVPTV